MNKPVRSAVVKALQRCQPLQKRGMVSSNAVPVGFFSSLYDEQHQTLRNGHLALQRLAFHASTTIELPVRRRRQPTTTSPRGEHDSSASNNNGPLQHNAVHDDVTFVQAARTLLDKLEKALEPMKRQNEIFEVERFLGDMGEVLTIDLGPKEGKYRVEMSLDDHVFEYTSPISGKVLYILSANTSEWVGIEDGHSFEGLLVRDLIRQCQGLPNL